MSLADGLQGLHRTVSDGGWIAPALAGGGLAVEVTATVLDPFGALLANGLGWAMEYFEPLREILDHLTGMPERIVAQTTAWTRIADDLRSTATDLRETVTLDLPDWQGTAADSYHHLMTANTDAIDGLSTVAATMAAATEAAGNLVTLTRDIVRDLITDLVGRVIIWATEALLVITIPLVAAQIAAAVARWGGRILGYTTALITSLTNLTRLLDG